jgi:hypothetical protein
MPYSTRPGCIICDPYVIPSAPADLCEPNGIRQRCHFRIGGGGVRRGARNTQVASGT